MLESLPLPTDIPAPTSYHWTPALQADFLGHLAATGSVTLAAKQVGMSPRAAHDLRHRADGAALAIGWAAAVLIARARLEDAMLDRALFGTEESWERTIDADAGTQRVTRRRHHVQSGLAMLARLDRMVETPAVTLDARLAQLAASDWASFLDLFAHGDFATAMADLLEQWFAARVAAPDRLAQIVGVTPIASEVAQISDDSPADLSYEEAVAKQADQLKMWWDGRQQCWVTNFPPTPDFAGEAEGEFGSKGYWRTLADDEQAVLDAAEASHLATLRTAAKAKRGEYFGLAAA